MNLGDDRGRGGLERRPGGVDRSEERFVSRKPEPCPELIKKIATLSPHERMLLPEEDLWNAGLLSYDGLDPADLVKAPEHSREQAIELKDIVVWGRGPVEAALMYGFIKEVPRHLVNHDMNPIPGKEKETKAWFQEQLRAQFPEGTSFLGAAEGPCSLGGWMREMGYKYQAFDIAYQFAGRALQHRIKASKKQIAPQIRNNPLNYTWHEGRENAPPRHLFRDAEHLIRIRENTAKVFLKHFEEWRRDGHIIPGNIMDIPFPDHSRDVVLSGNLLFLYDHFFAFQDHLKAVSELCRVSRKKVRMFPVMKLSRPFSDYLQSTLARLEAAGYSTKIVRVQHECHRGTFWALDIDTENPRMKLAES